MSTDPVGPVPLLAALRRHWVTIALCTLLAATAAAAWTFTRPTRYVSSATVMLSPVEGAPFNSLSRPADQPMQTERMLATRPAVLDAAVTELGPTASADQLRAGLSVSVPANTQVLQITYTADRAETARQGADAVAEAFLATRKASAVANRDARLRTIEEERKQALELISRTARSLSEASTPASKTALETELETYSKQLTTVVNQAGEVRQLPVDPGTVITPATEPTARGLLFNLGVTGAGLLAGLALGIALVLVRALLDRRVRGPESLPGEVVLGMIPRGNLTTGEPVTATAAGSEADDAYRRLRVALHTVTGPRATVVVSGVGTPHAAAVTAANLAVCAAQAGVRAVLLDAATDTGVDGASALLRVPPGTGLADVLREEAELADALQQSEWGPQVLTPGTGAAALAAGPLPIQPDHVLRQLRESFDLVLVVAPDPTSIAGEALATAADGTLLVAVTDETRAPQVRAAHRALESVQARVVGTAIIDRRRVAAARAGAVGLRARHNAGVTIEGRPR